MPDMHHTITIRAPAERVYEAITTQKGLQSWWTDENEAEPRLGSVAEFRFNRGAVVFRMRVDELVPSKRLHWTCVGGPEEWTGTKLTFDLTPTQDGGTSVCFTHAGWRSIEGAYGMCNTTWGHLMHYLKGYAEGKSPGPFFTR